MLEKDARQAVKGFGVLPQRRVFELQHVDLPSVDLPVDEPQEILAGEFANGVRQNRRGRGRPAARFHQQLDRRAHLRQASVRRQFLRVVQQHDQVQFAQASQFTHGLVHEHAPAVDWRNDRVRRNEQHPQPFRPRCDLGEAVAEVPSQRTPESLRVADHGQVARPPAGPDRLRQLAACPPQARKAGSQRRIADGHADQGAGQAEEEVRCQARPLVDVLPGPQEEVFSQDVAYLSVGEAPADGSTVLVIDDAARLIEHLPTALPGEEAEIGVLQVERLKQRVEAAQFEELRAVVGGGASAPVKARVEALHALVDAVTNP